MNWFFDPTNFWLIASRVSGMLLIIPAFSRAPIPNVARVAIIFWLSLSLLPTLPTGAFQASTAVELGVAVGMEVLFGMGLGFIVRIVFASVEMGATLMDTELGFRAAQQLNPAATIQGGPLTQMFVMTALLYFWVLDYFSIMVLAVRESFVLVPPFLFTLPAVDVTVLARISIGMFVGGLLIAVPILALMFAINVGMGFIAKSVQGLNIFFEFFILKIMVGISGVLLFLPLMLLILRNQFEQIIPQVGDYMEGLSVR